jgi:hypothetical protein
VVYRIMTERTSAGTDRMLLTIRLEDGSFVAAINYTAKQSKSEVSSGFWVQFIKRPELNPEQTAEIKALFQEEVQQLLETTFGDQK